MKEAEFCFKKAYPVWEKNKETVMNYAIVFFAELQGIQDYVLSVTGASSYTILVNDSFFAHGPARAAHGFYKVDEYQLKAYLKEGTNHIAIYCNGYNVNSFSYLDVPSFLCAEICLREEVIYATGINFVAFSNPMKIQKTQRYSYQRTFAESYLLYREYSTEVALARVEKKRFLKRDVPYCEYAKLLPVCITERGIVQMSEKDEYYNGREIVGVSKNYKGYVLEELEYASHIEYGKLDFTATKANESIGTSIVLDTNTYADLDMGRNQTGIFSLNIESKGEGTLFIAFDEMLTSGGIDPFRNLCSSIIALKLKTGTYHFVAAEPYGGRYIRLVSASTTVRVSDFAMYEVAYPESKIQVHFQGDDDVMKRIYEAAKLSFRANVVDIYMDCPQRERAGWLCDSFFTARVEKLLTGDSVVEKSFLQSFLLPKTFPNLVEGMLPMCYPAEVIKGEYLSNWAMWYALELYEYYERTGDRELVEQAKTRMESLKEHLLTYENADGFLVNLPGSFVDASETNRLAMEHDISFPTNMLYAAFQSVIGILYDRDDLIEKAEKLRIFIQQLSPNDEGFFRDNADYAEQEIRVVEECTEACQYYAFFFGLANPNENSELWNKLVNDFGYDRRETQKYPEIPFANAFIGNYLRLDLLARYGYEKELYDNIRGYFSYMADTTGTLWEYVSPSASCNHGYTSHVLCWMEQLGLLTKKI